jgi:ABC-type glycerol-3-phosphate transport system substrate-binding protein
MHWNSPLIHFFRLFFGAAILISAAGCSSRDQSRPDLVPSIFTGRTTITFAGFEHQRRLYEPLMEAFHKQNPDIRVQFVDVEKFYTEDVFTSADSYYRALAQAADTTIFPGVANLDMSRYFLNVQPLYEADPTFEPEDFWPGILSACVDANGSQVGIPLNASVSGVFFDRAAFEAAGLPEPHPGWTWDDFRRAVTSTSVVKEGQSKYGFYDQSFLYSSIIAPIAHEHLQANGGRVDSDLLFQEIRWYIEFVRAGQISGLRDPDALGSEYERFLSFFESPDTRPAMWFDSLSARMPDSSYTREPGNQFSGMALGHYGFAPVPVSVDGSLNNTSTSMVECASISAGSSNPQAAWTWLNYLSHHWSLSDNSLAYELSRSPARLSVAENAGYWDLLPEKAAPAVRFALEHSAYLSFQDIYAPLNIALIKTTRENIDFGQALADELSSLQLHAEKPPLDSPIVVATPLPGMSDDKTLVKYYIDTSSMYEILTLESLAEQFNTSRGDHQVKIYTELHSWLGESLYASVAENFDCFSSLPRLNNSDRMHLLNLNALLSSEPASFAEDFSSKIMEKYRYEGSLFGLPGSTQVQMMAYNSDLLARRGLVVPGSSWTFEDFIHLAAEAASTSVMDLSYGYLFSPYEDFFFLGMDVQWYDPKASPPAVHFNSPSMLSHLEWLRSLSEKNILLRMDDNWIEIDKAAAGGQLAFWTTMMGEKGSFFYLPDMDYSAAIGMLPLPDVSGDNPAGSVSRDRGHFISAYTQEARICWDWIVFLSEQPALFPGVPARRSVAESAAWESFVGPSEAVAFRAALERVRFPEQSGGPELYASWPLYIWRSEAVKAALGDGDLRFFLEDLQLKAENFLDCTRTLDTNMSAEQVEMEVENCARQADPGGNW